MTIGYVLKDDSAVTVGVSSLFDMSSDAKVTHVFNLRALSNLRLMLLARNLSRASIVFLGRSAWRRRCRLLLPR